ncbi:MAG TPA: hypothetical protein DCX41_05170 [Aequorivita sp.]|nr:hypothetical protein [Pusillimonas sp.]HAV54309.1 hypothetical protein [Aequorivita sp.]|tara:strand:+ start:15428 stop:15835 length:408 start_codon:yes stop_codon:yes gene_type:complete
MKYAHVQEYLEALFAGKDTVTETMIVQAKREYRKRYIAEYRKVYRKKYIQVSFRIPIDRYNAIRALAKELKIKTTTLVRQWVIQKQGNDSGTEHRQYQRYILQLMDIAEEAIEESNVKLLPELLSLLKQMQEEHP